MSEIKVRFVLLTGSNLGDRRFFLGKALDLVRERIGRVIKVSSVLESEPWGFESENNFLNQALMVEPALTPMEVLLKIQQIETELGRVRNNEQWVSRTIDIDILCWENLAFETDVLKIPHAQLHRREFALLPLCELAPNWIHPHLGISFLRILNNLADQHKSAESLTV